MTTTQRHVAATKERLATDIAARLREVIADAVASRGVAHVVLTGGSMGAALLDALGRDGAGDVDWPRVHLWWGDERFLPSGDPERNETQARESLLDALDLTGATLHPMPASDAEWGDDLDACARAYAAELAEHAGPGQSAPLFDVVMLGMGPDTHVASLFPGFPQTRLATATAVP